MRAKHRYGSTARQASLVRWHAYFFSFRFEEKLYHVPLHCCFRSMVLDATNIVNSSRWSAPCPIFLANTQDDTI
ncbi:MAG: hypothetical protein ABJZ69_16960, partial [Hyphomicrobiales bacterium]